MQGPIPRRKRGPLRRLQTVPLRRSPRSLSGEGVAILHFAQHGVHETAHPAKGDPGRRRGGLRVRDRKGDTRNADHPQGGPSGPKEGHSPGYPDGPVRLPGERHRLGGAQADDRQRRGGRRAGGSFMKGKRASTSPALPADVAQRDDADRVIVIGAGAGGMMAAGRAAERGAKVLLIEKTTGRGRSSSSAERAAAT